MVGEKEGKEEEKGKERERKAMGGEEGGIKREKENKKREKQRGRKRNAPVAFRIVVILSLGELCNLVAGVLHS